MYLWVRHTDRVAVGRYMRLRSAYYVIRAVSGNELTLERVSAEEAGTADLLQCATGERNAN
jgi:hypothetical protein